MESLSQTGWSSSCVLLQSKSPSKENWNIEIVSEENDTNCRSHQSVHQTPPLTTFP